MSRRRVPTALRLIRGIPKHKVNLREPVAPGDLLDPPPWLTPAQKESWRYAIEHAPKTILRKIDRGILAVWVVAEDTHAIASTKVASLGMLARSPKGYPMHNPYLSILNRQALIMCRAAGELGFTPAGRARLVSGEAAPSTERDDWEAISTA
jgi:P27 family predicted phage terminase small subunit